MSRRARHARAVSRRTISIISVIAIALSMFVGVVFLSGAQNPNKVTELNRSTLVQEVNLLPVDPDVSGSRTTLYAGTNGTKSGDYSDITVNADGSVDFVITENTTHNQTSSNDTSFVEAFTLVHQKINLAANPWLMVRWSGSGRCNGRVYFTVTYNGTEYGNKSKSYNDTTYSNSSGVVQTDLKQKSQQDLIKSGVCFALPLNNIINNNYAGYSNVNHTETDFNAGTVADYSVDIYKYITEQVENGDISLGTSHWPAGTQWENANKFYVTFYMSAQIIASESNKPLTAGTAIHWEKFAVGREALDRPASILPRSAEFMNITDTAGKATDNGRVSKLDDGSVTFSNTGSSDVVFEWNLRRYFNSTELESLHINATYSGITKAQFLQNLKLQTWFGGTTAYQYKKDGVTHNAKQYGYRGTEQNLIVFTDVDNADNSKRKYTKSALVTNEKCEAVINFNTYLHSIADDTKNYPTAYSKFYPEDSLIFVNNMKLTVPAGCKITFTRLEFQMENADIPATQANTVYPWVGKDAPNGLPPVGTAAYSTALNGASGMSYDWATDAKDAPIVKSKVDLLAMKTYSWTNWADKPMSVSDDDAAGVEYTRYTDGSSEYSSSVVRKDGNGKDVAPPTDVSYYTIMRYGPSDQWNRNYYTYLEAMKPVTKDGVTTWQKGATPYLYYSYEIVDETPNDGVPAQAGFYFHFQNAGRDTFIDLSDDNNKKNVYQYYLDQSGIALNACSSMFNIAYYKYKQEQDNSLYKYGAEATLSTATAKTGCVDIASLWVDGISNASDVENGQYLKLEELRIYLAPGTKIRINYFFFGGESLAQSVIDSGTLPREGGESFPWAVSKADFDKWTDPDSSQKEYTFANKVDLLKDIQDRVKVHNELAGSSYTAFPNATVDSQTGAVKVTVTNNAAGTNVNTGFLKIAGDIGGYDHKWKMQIASDSDFSSMRYLNYSVEAPAGLRWSIMFSEHSSSTSDQRAIMTWCDSDARWNDNNIYTAAPAGHTYLRMATATGYTFDNENAKAEYNTYWDGKHNTSWRIYSIPGSQTGCLDMRQVCSDFEWNNIGGIYLVAYQDPNLKMASGETPTVKFNYLYLTSTPIDKSNAGQAATAPDTIFNWGNTAVAKPKPGNAYTFYRRDTSDWTSSYAYNYTIDGKAPGKAVDLTEFSYLYYSYRLVEKLSDGTTRLADLPSTESLVSMWIIENTDSLGSVSIKRNTAGGDSNASSSIGATDGTNAGYGKASFIRQKDGNTTGANYTKVPYYGYAAETGCIDLEKYSIDDDNIYQIRFVVNNSLIQSGKYELYVDYLLLGTSASARPSFNRTYTPLNLAGAPTSADFRDNLDTLPKEVDLDETPYLFYSREYASGDRGTFAVTAELLKTNADGTKTVVRTDTFYRDASRTDGVLISAGANDPGLVKYMMQSETGCIDVRKWYIDSNIIKTESNQSIDDVEKLIRVKSVTYYGEDGTTHYLYFGAKADKTVDMLPTEARGRLNNGLPTRTWVVQTEGPKPGERGSDCEIYNADANGDGWDDYDTATKGPYAVPTALIKHSDDLTNDGYHDLHIQNSVWSQTYIRYGSIVNLGKGDTFQHSTMGNNQMSGLMIDLNETPYLHFSFEQPENSQTAMVLQTTNETATDAMNGQTADKTRPWLSAYCPTSPAGQLMMLVSNTTTMTFYKDWLMKGGDRTSVYGDHGGVIDLRSWYTETNGYSNVISLDSVRFYTYDNNGTKTDLKVNHLYLSSSASAAYAVTFNKNDGSGDAYTMHVIQNANAQYVDDTVLNDTLKKRDKHIFLGWYTDPECEQYFDIRNTKLTGNLHLYARWIDEAKVLEGTEINILEKMDFEGRTATGSGTASMDNEKLSITAESDLTVRFDVCYAYDVEDLRALFMGFDIDKTCKGFDIIVDAKCASSYEYSIVQDIFRSEFLTANGNLTAAPYDRETALYTYLGINDDLPTFENKGNLIEINAVTIVVPAGVSAEIRYIKAANEMSLLGKSDVRAPAVTNTIDLLDNANNETAFINAGDGVVYTKLDATSKNYLNKGYTQAAVHAVDTGYVHLGGLYDHTINMTDSSTSNPGRYLYFAIDQPEDSYFTFALYTAFSGLIEGSTQNVCDKEVHGVYTQKAVSYYSQAAGGLVAKDYGIATEDFVPAETAYVNGNLVGKIDLYQWYKDALNPYRSVNKITAVELLGVRFFTSSKSTDTNIHYFFIGNDETEESKGDYEIFAESGYLRGQSKQTDHEEYRHMLEAKVKRGETLYVTLDQLDGIADKITLDDPSKKFVGWVFRDIAHTYLPSADRETVGLSNDKLTPYLVYWNPEAKNGNMWHPTKNADGSWYVKNRTGTIDSSYEAAYDTYQEVDKKVPSTFKTDVKSVFYTFATNRGNTQVILPIFEEYKPTVSVTVSGTGSVSMTADGQASAGTNKWTVPYATQAVLHASGSNFVGWYDQDGVLVSSSRDCHLIATNDTVLTAKFGGTAPGKDALVRPLQSGKTIVWLQSANLTAGSDIKLVSVNDNTDIAKHHPAQSNIDDTTGTKNIICYWNVDDSQMLKAVAPSGYHWEHLLQDGTTVRASSSNIYTFVASTNIRLLCVADSGTVTSKVLMDENAFDDNRANTMLRFNGQVVCGEGEKVLTCGLTFISFRNHNEMPSVDCSFSETVTAKAWNSTTGQFTVEFDLLDKVPCVVRGYAVIEKADGTKSIVYSDCVSSVF